MPLTTNRSERSQHERDLVAHLVRGSEMVWRLAYVIQEFNKDNGDSAWNSLIADAATTLYDLGQANFGFALELFDEPEPDIPF